MFDHLLSQSIQGNPQNLSHWSSTFMIAAVCFVYCILSLRHPKTFIFSSYVRLIQIDQEIHTLLERKETDSRSFLASCFCSSIKGIVGRFDPRSHFLLSTKPSIQCISSRALRWNRCHELVYKGIFSFSLVKFSSSSRSLEKLRSINPLSK